eukprot:scpid95420/ scgid4496/ Latrophilin-3; Lectomedin-3
MQTGALLKPTCVYWSYGKGGWATDGCYLDTDVTDLMNNVVQCKCTHLTNFAVLVSRSAVKSSQPADKALSIITYIGCTLSAIALIGSMATVASFKAMRARRHNRIVFLLSMDMLLAIVFFVFGIRTATSSPNICTVIALLLHFLFLLMFSLTSLEAIMLYKQIVDIFGMIQGFTIKILILLTAGVPFCIVFLAAAITKLSAHGNSKYCWITEDGVFYGSFIAPMCVSLLTNIAVLVRVTVSLRRSGSAVASSIKSTDTSSASYLLRVVVSLSVLLGISWLFGA